MNNMYDVRKPAISQKIFFFQRFSIVFFMVFFEFLFIADNNNRNMNLILRKEIKIFARN